MPQHDAGSVKARLKANRERLLRDKTETLKIPGYDSLYARYHRPDWSKVSPLLGLAAGNSDSTQDVSAAMELLIDGCDEFLFIEDGEETPLGVKYEQGLAELLGVTDAQSPPEVIDALFVEEIDLMNHAGDYVAWVVRLQEQATQELGKGSTLPR